MATLTIRLDETTEGLLSHFAEVTNQTKSDIVRAGLIEYLKHQQAKEAEKERLVASFTVSSKQHVAQRIEESEASYQLSDEEYEKEMEAFFFQELGLIR